MRIEYDRSLSGAPKPLPSRVRTARLLRLLHDSDPLSLRVRTSVQNTRRSIVRRCLVILHYFFFLSFGTCIPRLCHAS